MVNFISPLFLDVNNTIQSLGSRQGIMGRTNFFDEPKWESKLPVSPVYPSRVRLNVAANGGEMPDVQLFDDVGNPTTTTAVWNVGTVSNIADYDVWPGPWGDDRTQWKKQPSYLRLYHGGDDAICISMIGVEGPPAEDGKPKDAGHQQYLIFGDLMQTCAWDWYEGKDTHWLGGSVQEIDWQPLQEVKPHCFWLGGHGRKRPDYVWFHLPDFDGKEAAQRYNGFKTELCAAKPRMSRSSVNKNAYMNLVFYPPLTYRAGSVEGGSSSDEPTQFTDYVMQNRNWHYNVFGIFRDIYTGQPYPARRGLPSNDTATADETAPDAGKDDFATKFLQWDSTFSHSNSSEPRYSAVQKCQEVEQGLTGPDWANSYERLYCHLATQRVLPYCESPRQQECWDAEETMLRGSAEESVRARQRRLRRGRGTSETVASLNARAVKEAKKTVRWDY